MALTSADYDVKITKGATTRKLRLLQTREGKAWSVQEIPPTPQLALGGSAKEGMPPTQLLPFEMEDWSFGTGLLRFTPQTERPGHVLRYADGFGIDTSEVGIVRHGPRLLSDVGTLAEAPIEARVFDDQIWFLTANRLYSWDGTTLKSEWDSGHATPPDTTLKAMEIHSGEIIIAAGTKYWHTDGTGSPITIDKDDVDWPADYLLTLGKQLWRAHTTNKISSSVDPTVADPVWLTDKDVGDGTAINNLYGLSGLLGVATQQTLYTIDSDFDSLELNKLLRTRRGTKAFSIKSESGTDVWFSDGKEITRVVAQGFEVWDIQRGGPFQGIDELPVSFPEPGTATIRAIVQDAAAPYIIVNRGSDAYVYKGKELSRSLFAWSPLLKDASVTPGMAVLGKLSGDSAPIIYYNDGATIKRFSTEWTTYVASWELHTPYFTASLESWDKMWHKVRAFLSKDDDAKLTVYYRINNVSGWTLFGSTGEMTSDGNNEISLSAALAGKRVQLRFVGSTGCRELQAGGDGIDNICQTRVTILGSYHRRVARDVTSS